MSNVYRPSDAVIETISGFNAGVVATLVAHPLDVVKTRLQGNSIPCFERFSLIPSSESKCWPISTRRFYSTVPKHLPPRRRFQGYISWTWYQSYGQFCKLGFVFPQLRSGEEACTSDHRSSIFEVWRLLLGFWKCRYVTLQLEGPDS